jgi:poly(3-hydroxybutyrate) depolymerase
MSPSICSVLCLAAVGCATPIDSSELPAVGETAQAVTDPIPQVAGMFPLRFDVSNGDQRAYLLRLPAGYNPARPAPYPMVVLFHGAGQSAQAFAARPGLVRMQALADAQGKILVFAEGAVGTSVTAPGTWDATAGGADLLFAEELTDFLATSPDLDADPARVLAAGFSAGGHFVHALGAEAPTQYLAIGVVSGYYGSTVLEPAPPPAGTLLPVFIVHGDADTTLPIAGGDPVAAGGLRLSTQTSYDRWYTNDGCTRGSAIPVLPPPRYTYEMSPCRGSAVQKLRFTTVFGLGHLWPVAADGFDASAGLLTFFNAL